MTAHPLHAILADLDEQVPALMAEVGKWGKETLIAEADRCADVIAHYADSIWHTKPAKKSTAPSRDEVLTAIALGAAILARRSNGVQLADRHWCTTEDCDPTATHAMTVPAWKPRPFDFRAVDVDASRTGAHFTPRDLAEDVTKRTLDGIVLCPGPRHTDDETQWAVGPSALWLGIQVADIACGSGAFLLAAVRYLADARLANDDTTFRTVASTRMWFIEHAVWGADLNPWSIDLARVALGLLAPMYDTHDLDKHLIPGDSLIGPTDDDPDAHEVQAAFGDRRPIHWHGKRFDAIIGNPPFLGGSKITGVMGVPYRERLVATIAGGKRGAHADLCVFFLLRAHQLITPDGQVGIIGTNTLAQGDCREVGLDQIVAPKGPTILDYGATIRYAVKSAPWPGAAAVQYCVVVTSATPVDKSVKTWTSQLDKILPPSPPWTRRQWAFHPHLGQDRRGPGPRIDPPAGHRHDEAVLVAARDAAPWPDTVEKATAEALIAHAAAHGYARWCWSGRAASDYAWTLDDTGATANTALTLLLTALTALDPAAADATARALWTVIENGAHGALLQTAARARGLDPDYAGDPAEVPPITTGLTATPSPPVPIPAKKSTKPRPRPQADGLFGLDDVA